MVLERFLENQKGARAGLRCCREIGKGESEVGGREEIGAETKCCERSQG
jgi:hypothetical protein